MRQLVFVHGRAQEHKDAVALKGEWIAALRQGLAKSGLALPTPEDAVRFPYYGQALFDLVAGVPAGQAAEVIVRGEGADTAERDFAQAILDEVKEKAGITDDQIASVVGGGADGVVERGALNWEWVQGVLKAIDRYVPFGSGGSIALFTKDVYQYLRNPGLRDTIETGVRQALQRAVPTVVVAHSLGTVVAYNLLRREGQAQGWNVPLLVTVGSPLAITAIKRALAPLKHPDCVGHWFNAMDERDVVALYPLDSRHFPIHPDIENKTDVENHTENRHGIAGYLDDVVVARRVYEALGG
jgi:hypothetical protein